MISLKPAGRAAVSAHQKPTVPRGGIGKPESEPDLALAVFGVGDDALEQTVAADIVDSFGAGKRYAVRRFLRKALEIVDFARSGWYTEHQGH